MTNQDRTELQEMINNAVAKGVAEGVVQVHSGCRFTGVEPQAVGLIMQNFRELGDGDVMHGIAIARDNNRALVKIRRLGENIGGKLAIWMCVTLFGGGLALMGWGLCAKLSEIAGGPK